MVRCSRRAPRRVSSSCTLRLTVVLGRPSDLAAAMKLPCSTTLTKISVSLRSWDMVGILDDGDGTIVTERLDRERDDYSP
ncbi:hypothetical protein BN1263190054 [Stenotrophomonas thermophila]|nr:hypothetical protein BN1263190054 [Stenotrophomonas maltophilia]